MIEVVMAHLNWVIAIVTFCIPAPIYWVLLDDFISERKEKRRKKLAGTQNIARVTRNDSIY